MSMVGIFILNQLVMSRREAIIVAYGVTIVIAIVLCLVFFVNGQDVPETGEQECTEIDGSSIPVVYGDDGTPYLKYIIGEQNIYIPIPTEPDTQTDSLQFYYTKNQQNERRF